MEHSPLFIRVIELVSGFILLVGILIAVGSLLGGNLAASAIGIYGGVSLMISSMPLFLITQIAEDIRKSRVASQFLLRIQMQQSLYLSEVKTLLDESVDYSDRLLGLQTKQFRSSIKIEALLSESTVSNGHGISGSGIASDEE